MKIIHYVDENNLTWSRAWIQLIKSLADKHVENLVVCKSGGTLLDQLQEENMPHMTCDLPIAWLPFATVSLGHIIDDFQPDIIHTRLSSAARTGGWWGKKKHIPVVETLDKAAKLRYYKNADMLLCCSDFVRRDMIAQGFEESKTRLLYNTIDCYLYRKNESERNIQRVKLSISESTKVIVAAGRFDRTKGFEYLIKAFASLVLVNTNLKLMLLGDGILKTEYHELIRSLNIEDKVMMPGFVQDIRPWFWAADIFVLPSSVPEAFGIVLLEAMACGLPVIATSCGGPSEIVRNGHDGITVRSSDDEAIRIALEMLLKDDKTRNLYAIEAEKRAKDFDIVPISSQLMKYYDELSV